MLTTPLFGFVPVGYQATRWMAHLRTEVFSLALNTSTMYFLFDRVRPAQPLYTRVTWGIGALAPTAKLGFVGIDHAPTGYG